MKRICSICARGGSKGVPGKNIRMVAGKPLIAHSITQALRTGLFETIAVSSDSEEILNVAGEYGAQVLIQRPSELAKDTSAKLPVIKHCLLEAEKISNLQYDTVVDLDCTSPLRTAQDIRESVAMYESSSATNLITGMKARRSPYFNLVELTDSGHVRLAGVLEKPILRRQDAPICYDMNASIYIWHRQTLLDSSAVINEKTIIYEMPEERSIDIDSAFDFEIVSYLLEKRINEHDE